MASFYLALMAALAVVSPLHAEESKIIGGTPVASTERPWVVKIHRQGKGHCTGSLIGKSWILTAAHCFVGTSSTYQEYSVGAGGDGSFANLERLPSIKAIFLHPNYRGQSTTAQDLALIKLSSPVTVSPQLAPIPLKNLTGTSLSHGPAASIAAWGLTDARGTLATQLQSITLPVRRTTELVEIPDFLRSSPHLLNTGVLVMIKTGVTTCRGDSGAGWTMVVNGSPYLIGVHSAGDYCQSIAVAAEVSHSLLWIKTRMLLSGY